MVKYRISYEIIRYGAIYISEEMGTVLKNTAFSPNIKDRLDHSCAILSPSGELVAQAEHIPVHIGSMSLGCRNVIDYFQSRGETLNDGDIVIVNNPYIAGTHLNDVMLVKPVFHDSTLIAYLANKAHHVDIGGSVPGSIGGDSKDLFQEGLIIPPLKLFRENRLDEEIMKLMESNVRTSGYFRGDLNAQLASLYVGENRLVELVDKYGIEEVLDTWEYILNYGERYLRKRLKDIGVWGTYEATDYIELPSSEMLEIRVKIDISDDNIKVDFSGTSVQVDYPVNAVLGVTMAATTFALKSVIDPVMPINDGINRVIKFYVPYHTLLNPYPPAPVSGGNLETSQRIADVVLKALSTYLPEKVPAASSGSMNNIMIGGVLDSGLTWAFYETVGGGSGGRPNEDGVDGVHTNMTNTLNTPIEVLEREYPLLFIKYSLREDSGGAGKFRGGLGISRVFKVLEKSYLTIMTDRVIMPPWGLKGGLPGKAGEHYVEKSDGRIIKMLGKMSIELDKGDIVHINTPGGGGYGDPCDRNFKYIKKDVQEGKLSIEHIRRFYCLEEI